MEIRCQVVHEVGVCSVSHSGRHQVAIMTGKDLGQLISLGIGVQLHLNSCTYLCLLWLLIQKGMGLQMLSILKALYRFLR